MHTEYLICYILNRSGINHSDGTYGVWNRSSIAVKYVKIRAGITHAELGQTNTSDESKIASTLLYCCTNTIRLEREWLA